MKKENEREEFLKNYTNNAKLVLRIIQEEKEKKQALDERKAGDDGKQDVHE